MPEGDSAACDPADVEQIVDQPRPDGASWRSIMVHACRTRLVGAARQLQRLERVAHRRQRIAQLVRERREELVLAPVGLPQRRASARCLRSVTSRAIFEAPTTDAAVVPNRRDGQRDVRRCCPSLRRPHGVEVLEALARSQIRARIVVLLVDAARGGITSEM